MLDRIIDAVAIIALLLLFLYFWGSIAERLPPKFEIKRGEIGRPRFGAWVEVVDFAVSDFRVGHVDEWEIGHELRAVCHGTVEHGEDHRDRKVYINFFSVRDAYKRSNIIGTADATGEHVNVYLRLAPEQVRDIVGELRLARETTMHVHGWQDAKTIRIDYFSMEPSAETKH